MKELAIFILSLPIGLFFMNAARVLTDPGHWLEFIPKYFPTPDTIEVRSGKYDEFGEEKIKYKWVPANWREWLAIPLYVCEYCTASIWGSLAYSAALICGGDIRLWPYFIVSLVGARYMLNSFLLYRKIQVKQTVSYDEENTSIT